MCVTIVYVYFHSEWLVNQHRDSFASFIGHHDMVSYFALVENESKARIKFNLMQVQSFVVWALGWGVNISCGSLYVILCTVSFLSMF